MQNIQYFVPFWPHLTLLRRVIKTFWQLQIGLPKIMKDLRSSITTSIGLPIFDKHDRHVKKEFRRHDYAHKILQFGTTDEKKPALLRTEMDITRM